MSVASCLLLGRASRPPSIRLSVSKTLISSAGGMTSAATFVGDSAGATVRWTRRLTPARHPTFSSSCDSNVPSPALAPSSPCPSSIPARAPDDLGQAGTRSIERRTCAVMKKGSRPAPDQPPKKASSPLPSPTTDPSRSSQAPPQQQNRPSLSLSRRNASGRLSGGPASPQSPRRNSQPTNEVVRTKSGKISTLSSAEKGIGQDSPSDMTNAARPVAEQQASAQASPGSPQTRLLKRASTSGIAASTLKEMEAAFASPTEGGLHTTSTHSTESGKTVRATSLGQPPDDFTVRTPSYPFPYVSSASGSNHSTPLHQPFTALSPSGPSERLKGRSRLRQRFASSSGTPEERRPSFAPSDGGENKLAQESPFRTPDLYELVLQLNAEPNMESWWPRLTSIMHEHYKAHRLSLAIPTDTTDVENVPWGQQASYNTFGLQMGSGFVASISGASWGSSSSASRSNDTSEQAVTSGSFELSDRPTLFRSRSYAVGDDVLIGSAGGENMKQATRGMRPMAPRSMTSHPTGSSTRFTDLAHRPDHSSPYSLSWQSDNREEQEEPKDSHSEKSSNVYTRVQPLDRENDALLEPASVNRVLEKGSLVLLTRDFNVDGASQQDGSDQTTDTPSLHLFNIAHHKVSKPREKMDQPPVTKYEDYEQLPTNLWSQSPAPSPAIQHDPDENPFFAEATVSEDSFEPTPINEPDYSQGFEAIGVDRASTIIHVPLIHPLLSRSVPMPEMYETALPETTRLTGIAEDGNDTTRASRKVPIAILSIMSDIVPYPRNWTRSIEHLGPHLATSFQTCYQNSLVQERIDRALRGNQRLKHIANMPLEGVDAFSLGAGLDSLLRYDDDGASSTIGSMTSPSEIHSTNSGQSPPDSLTGTPAAVVPDSQSSYFDIKQRQSLERSRSSAMSSASLGQSAAGRTTSADHRAVLRKVDVGTANLRDDKRTPTKRDQISKPRDQTSKPRDQTSKPRDQSSSRPTTAAASKGAPNSSGEEMLKRELRVSSSVLHSYGADFKTSFPSLPMTATPKPSSALPSRSSFAPTSPLDTNNNVAPSDRLLRILIDALPVQVFIAQPEVGHLTWVNSKFLAYGGLTASDVYTSPTWQTVHPEDVKECRERWAKHLRTGQQFQHKTRMRRFDGAYRHHYVRAAPLRSTDQRIVHWVGTITDFHDQHVAETSASKQHETAQSEAKYRALANSSPQITFAAKRHKGIIFCNSQWQAYSGQSEENSKGLGFMECVHPDDLIKCNLPDFDGDDENPSNVPISMPVEPRRTSSSGASPSEYSEVSGDTAMATTAPGTSSPVSMLMPQRKLSELASQGILKASKDATGKKSYSTEVRLRMTNKEYRWHLIRVLLAEPLIQAEFSEERDETWYGTCTDINDHKELEQTLKDTMDAKSRFLSNMSHEIRTPLNGIWGMTNFLIDSNLTNEQADHVNVIRSSTEGLRDLINDILDLSKVEAGMIKLNMDWLHVRSIVEEVNDLLSTMALDKGIELNYLVERDVPSMMKGDRFRMRQVLLNLINNAIKFTDEGEVFVRCHKLPAMPEDLKTNSAIVQVDILDTGRGFSDKEAEMLFKRFSQIDGSSTRQHGGSGLGLVISMQLVELHGGTMTATSTAGKGSCFTFTTRLGLPTENDQPPPTPMRDANSVATEPMSIAALKSASSPSESLSPVERARQMFSERELTLSPTALPSQGIKTPSSAGSEISNRTILSATASTRSSQSSAGSADVKPMHLQIKPEARPASFSPHKRIASVKVPNESIKPLLYSILVVSPLPWSRDAAVGHLNGVLDGEIPHTVTARASMEEVEILTEDTEPVNFTHIIIIMKDTVAALKLVARMFEVQSSSTSVILVSDLDQKRTVLERTDSNELGAFIKSRRLQFVPKPMKPSRLAVIFDPSKQRELSTDINKSSAQQIKALQTQVLDDMARRLGSRGVKVLLVEDNKINQMVVTKLLDRVSISVDLVMDGVQATDQVFKMQPGYYSIVLMDLMMPNKDGYESCSDIRAWERKNNYAPLPIIALSANVLGDVWQKCKEAGFNSYLTKPLQFTELSEVMTDILDPEDPNQPLMTMRGKGGPSAASMSSGRR